MQLNSLSLSHLRNLHAIQLELNPQLNIFWGENGGGKTSLLEAVHVLGTGRSFRASQSRQIITFGQGVCRVSGVVSSHNPETLASPVRLGVERALSGTIKMRVGEQDCHSIATLAQTLPLQLINSESYDLLEASPQLRRQFLDWALFHVEHSFYPTWQRFKRVLEQRNAAIKAMNANTAGIRAWDKELIETGEEIDSARRAILQELSPIFSETLKSLLSLTKETVVQYSSGWGEEDSLAQAIEKSLERDRAWGYTTMGPQRADLEFLIGKVPAKNLLSRGQLKLFICSLLMARAILLYRRQGRRCVFLVDDLNSELDHKASERLIEALLNLGGQVLVTSIDSAHLTKVLRGKEYSLFQVEAGNIFS